MPCRMHRNALGSMSYRRTYRYNRSNHRRMSHSRLRLLRPKLPPSLPNHLNLPSRCPKNSNCLHHRHPRTYLLGLAERFLIHPGRS